MNQGMCAGRKCGFASRTTPSSRTTSASRTAHPKPVSLCSGAAVDRHHSPVRALHRPQEPNDRETGRSGGASTRSAVFRRFSSRPGGRRKAGGAVTRWPRTGPNLAAIMKSRGANVLELAPRTGLKEGRPLEVEFQGELDLARNRAGVRRRNLPGGRVRTRCSE